jgi:hypothetical protein
LLVSPLQSSLFVLALIIFTIYLLVITIMLTVFIATDGKDGARPWPGPFLRGQKARILAAVLYLPVSCRTLYRDRCTGLKRT